jgi:hypothetical protein
VTASLPDHYTAQDVLTDPGPHARRLDELPATLPELHAAINGLLLHVWKARAYHPHLFTPPPREVFVRHTTRLLDHILKLDPAPLNVARPVERRAVVDCRHFAVLLCAVLRRRGIPARPRCGFASYLSDGVLTDHWICEFWDHEQGRWVMEDADKERHDVPVAEFLTGSRAWQLCRQTPSLAEQLGYSAKQRGAWVARANLIRDVASLNGFPSVSGDIWGLGQIAEADVTPADLETLDSLAGLVACASDAPGLDALRTMYEATPGLRAPDIIPHCDHFNANTWRSVAWRTEP